MAHLDSSVEHTVSHPMDVIEDILIHNGWRFDRGCDDEVAAEMRGKWCDYSLHFSFSREIEAVHFTCAFDARVPKARMPAVHQLLALINDRLWLGHFSVWGSEALPMFRHALLLRGQRGITRPQIEDLLDIALSECERFYPAFQFVVWGGKPPVEAIEAAIIDPIGEA